jgi:hypothetical protein
MTTKLGWTREDHDKDQAAQIAREDFLRQLKAAKLSVQLAMEMCGFKTERGAKLNGIWEELQSLTESVEAGDL